MRSLARRIAPWIACAVAATAAVHARAEVERVATEAGSGITIEVEGWAGIGIPATGRHVGLLPLEVTIANASTAAHRWTIGPDDRFRPSQRPVPTATIVVPAGGTGRTTLFVEVDDGGMMLLDVRGHGIPGGSNFVNVAANRSPPVSPADADWRRQQVGQSKQVVAARAGRPADAEIVPLDMARAPTDWRGWSALAAILMTADEWRGLSVAARKAAVEWVTLGGRLVVFAKEGDDDLPGLPRDGRRSFRAGAVAVVSWDGERIEERAFERATAEHAGFDAVLSRYRRQADDSSLPMHRYPGRVPDAQSWERGFGRLAGVFGPRTLPVGAILAFLAVFGLVAGPLNVMVFAGPGRRSRMFWTTPAISLTATAFLLGLMFLRDGVGGSGARRVFAVLDPERATMAVIQEQFSRTGVLLGSTFPIGEPSWMHPLMEVPGDDPLVETDGAVRSGGWFRSRSDQAYLLEAVRPSRARIEFLPPDGAGGPPAVVSSVEVPLDRVFVVDVEGGLWQAFAVGTGEKKSLQPATGDDIGTWFEGLLADAGPARAQAIKAVQGRRGLAFASTKMTGRVAIQTLGSIRWIDDGAAFVCPIAGGAAP